MAIGPLQHHKPLVRLAHLVGSEVFSMQRISSTFKYCVSSTPSSWMIKQVMLSALTKKLNFLNYRVSGLYLATAPMAKWSAQIQLFTPTKIYLYLTH